MASWKVLTSFDTIFIENETVFCKCNGRMSGTCALDLVGGGRRLWGGGSRRAARGRGGVPPLPPCAVGHRHSHSPGHPLLSWLFLCRNHTFGEFVYDISLLFTQDKGIGLNYVQHVTSNVQINKRYFTLEVVQKCNSFL